MSSEKDKGGLPLSFGGGGLDSGETPLPMEEPDTLPTPMALPHDKRMFDEMHPAPVRDTGDDRAASTATLEALRANPEVTGAARVAVEEAISNRRRYKAVKDPGLLQRAVESECTWLEAAGKPASTFGVLLELEDAIAIEQTIAPYGHYSDLLERALKKRREEA